MLTSSILLNLFLIASAAIAQVSQQGGSPSTAPTHASAPVGAIPSYPNTAAGLEKLVKEMMKLQKNGDQQALASYTKSLMLPDAENWFKSVFGEEKGRALAAASDRMRKETELSAAEMLAEALKQKRNHIQAVLLGDSCKNPTAPEEYSVLFLRQRPEDLYDVRFFDDSLRGSAWRYFAYVDGGFRYVGNVRKEDAQIQRSDISDFARPNSSGASPKRISMIQTEGDVQAAQLVCQLVPTYPQEAKAQRIQGKVILHAIIDVDGTIAELEPVSGPPEFVEPSIKAVRWWHYKPTLLKGEAVQVDTTITVIFTLEH